MKSFLFFLLTINFLYGDVKSTTGKLNFDVNFDQQSEMSLSSQGLNIGSSQLATANLQVQGNALISKTLSIGTTQSQSNLNLSGTISFSTLAISDNINLNDETSLHSYYLANSASTNIMITLPYTGNVEGSLITIKKVSTEGEVIIRTSDNSIDQKEYFFLTDNLPYVKLLCDGSEWHIVYNSSTGTQSGWDPSYLSDQTNLLLWLDGSDESTLSIGATDNVYQWNDKSNYGNHVTQSSNTLQPTYNSRTLNELNVLDFNSDVLDAGININRSVMAKCTVFIVYATDNTSHASNTAIWGQDNGGWDRFVVLTHSAGSARWAVSNGSTGVSISDIDNTDPLVLSTHFDQGVASGSFAYVNGALSATFTEGSGTGNSEFGIGSISTVGTTPLDGYIAEFLLISNTISESERQKVEGYLAWKWGLEADLVAGHPYEDYSP